MCATLGWRHVLQTHDHLVLRRDALLLKTPWVKHLIQQSCVAHWTRTMATLFAAGVPLTQALAYTRPVTGNRMYELATHDMAQQLLSGHTLSQGLGAHGALFPALLVQMCAIGEESGALEHMLSKMADMAEQDLHTSVTYLSKLVEPTLMLILGLGVGVLVMALYLPIFQMGQVV
jgi:type IV pilus assembly protein PilC